MHISRAVSLAALVALFSAPGACLAGAAEIKRFQSEYPAAGRRWADHLAHLQGRAVVTYEGNAAAPASASASVVFSAGHQFYKVEMVPESKNRDAGVAEMRVYVLGPDRDFSLNRPAGRGEYEMDARSWGTTQYPDYTRAFGRFLMSPHALHGRSISQLMNESGFQILSAEPVGEDPSLMLVQFEYDVRGHRFRGEVRFDTERVWAIRRAESYQVGVDVRSRMDSLYDGTSDGMPTLKTVKLHDFDGRNYRCEIEEAHEADVTEAEFSPLRYGLPDMGPPRKTSRGYGPMIWAAVAAAGLAVAWLLRKLAMSPSRGVQRR